MKIFTYYSKELHDYLRICGNDVHRLDNLVQSGATPTFIGSHYLDQKNGWVKGISGVTNERPGTYVDNGFQIQEVNDFYEWHGGERLFV